MLRTLKTRAYEALRCTRHNLLHLKMFKIRYDGRVWHVTDRVGTHLTFPFYPYKVFYETEGYLRQGRWDLHEGMTVIDAGACFGEFALYAARRVGNSGRVIMLEPDADNIRRAQEYFDFNGGQPATIEIIPAGIWKVEGNIQFAAGLDASSTLLDAGQPIPPGAHIIEVPVESLSSLARKYALKRIDLVKMDIEGAEVEVVQSAQEAIEQFSPRFSIASYHMRLGQPTSQIIEPLFRNYGYATQTGWPDHQTTWAAPTL
jgi:FkbM family methyltransferase